jgi:thiamine-phosphate pyrophosphorylase
MYSKIQYISQGITATEQFNNIQQALDAGCSWIQLRFKTAGKHELVPLAEKVRLLCNSYEATFILNDYAQLAKQLDADGVHLGLLDTAISDARKILGAEKIIGGTANTLSDVLQRVQEGCDYIGLGPLRFTTTKEKLSPIIGMAGYRYMLNELKKGELTIPVYAIGGVKEEDVKDLSACGVYGIAVSGIITQHPHKKQLVKNLKTLLYVPTDYCQYEI